MGDIQSTLLSHTELNVKLTLKQDDAKNERRSLSTTFSINRRRGSMCAVGAVLEKNNTKEAPELCQLYHKNNLVCLCDTEFWVNCGGVQPYSDSYTISLYTNEKMSGFFQHEVLSVCLKNNYSICNIIDSVNPYQNRKKSFLAKLLNRL